MLKNRKKLLYLVIPIVVVLGIVVLVQGVHAQTGIGAFFNPLEWFLLGIAWLIYGLVWLGGQLLLGLTVILIWVASYNNFINEPIVNVGWVIIRDLSNMVFIVALLYMAFNMVFGMKGKGGASLLTLIISAGLINFSKVIAGLFIDISQVIMLSFVHGFYNIAGGNLMEAFGLQNMLSLKAITNDAIPDTGGQASILTMIGTIILALIMVYIAIGLVLTIIIVLVGRILQLWGLLIFSPTPWVGKLVPGLSKFTGDWWDKLTKYCTSGPVLAFFLWLTFTAVDLYSKSGLAEPFGTAPLRETNQVGGIQGGTQVAGLSQAGSIQHMLSFIVIIGLLYLSLDYANKFGIMTASFAGKSRKWLHQRTGVKAFNRYIKEPLASKQQLWAQGGGIMKYGNKFLASLPGPLRTSWAGLTTKEGEAREKEMRHAKRMGKGWQRTITGVRVPFVAPKGWRVKQAAMRGEEGKEESEKILKQADVARNLVLFKKIAGQGESWQKIYEEDKGFKDASRGTIMKELKELASGPQTDEARAKFIAVANIASKKGLWNGLDKKVMELGGKMFGGEGSYMHRLLEAKVEEDSKDAMGSKAGVISPIRVDPVTKEPVNLMPKQYEKYEEDMEDGSKRKVEGVRFGDRVIPVGGLRRFMGEKWREDNAAKGSSQAVRQLGKNKERSIFRGKSLYQEYDPRTGQYQPMDKEDMESLHQEMGLEIEGNVGGVMKSFGAKSMFGRNKWSMAHDYNLRNLHNELGGLADEYITNIEGYKEEVRGRVMEDEHFTATLEGMNEEDRKKAIEEQVSREFGKQMDLSLEGKLRFNDFYRALSLDTGATLFAITPEESEQYKQELRQDLFRKGRFGDIEDSNLPDGKKEELKRKIVDDEARRKLGVTDEDIDKQNQKVRKARRTGWSDLQEDVSSEGAKQRRELIKQKNDKSNQAEKSFNEYKMESADRTKDFTDVLSTAAASLDNFRKQMERVFPDLIKTLKDTKVKADNEYEKGLEKIRGETDLEEQRRIAKESLKTLNSIFMELKELDEKQAGKEAASGPGGTWYDTGEFEDFGNGNDNDDESS